MVRVSYQQIEETYADIKENASGRQACTIMIMVANEVDAMSAARMLMQHLRSDNIAYVMRPVATIKHIKQAYDNSITSDIRSIILINCGALYNLPKLFNLELGGDVRVFVMDNHRPFHLSNVYSRHNVVCFDDLENVDNEADDIPSDGSILSAEGSDESSDDHSDDDDASEDMSDMDRENISEEGSMQDDKDEPDEVESEAEAEMDDNVEEHQKKDDDKADDELLADDEEESEKDEEEEDDGDEEKSVDIDNSDGDDAEDDNNVEDAEKIDENKDPNSNIDTQVEDSKKRPLESLDYEEDQVVGKRRKILEENYDPEKIRKRKLREYYTKNATFTAPTSLMMLSLVYGRHGTVLPLDIIWQAILGLTDQHLRNHVTEEWYERYCNYLRGELLDHFIDGPKRGEYTVMDGETQMTVGGAETGNIKETLEYRFFMHRHWSLFDAMFHSPYIASKLKVWQTSGRNQLQELLAKIGLPLHQSQQSFNFIPPQLRRQFQQEISDVSSRQLFNLTNPDVLYRSFSRFNSFKSPIAATDVVLAATALLEKSFTASSSQKPLSTPTTDVRLIATPSTGTTTASEETDQENDLDVAGQASRLAAFNEAYDCLGMKSSELLKKGITISIDLQKMLVKKAAILLEDHSDLIVRLSRFYYCRIDSHSMTTNLSSSAPSSTTRYGVNEFEADEPFTRPHVLTRLGQFVMDVKRNLPLRQGGWVGTSLLPLIMFSQKRSSGTYVVVGISPLQSNLVQQDIQEKHESRLHVLTNFRQLFKFAAEECKARFWNDSFDTNVVEVHQDDLTDFLGELNDIMKRVSAAT